MTILNNSNNADEAARWGWWRRRRGTQRYDKADGEDEEEAGDDGKDKEGVGDAGKDEEEAGNNINDEEDACNDGKDKRRQTRTRRRWTIAAMRRRCKRRGGGLAFAASGR